MTRSMNVDELKTAKKNHQAWLDCQEEVTAVGIGVDSIDQNPCLKIFVRSINDQLKNQISNELKSIPFEIIEGGPFLKQNNE